MNTGGKNKRILRAALATSLCIRCTATLNIQSTHDEYRSVQNSRRQNSRTRAKTQNYEYTAAEGPRPAAHTRIPTSPSLVLHHCCYIVQPHVRGGWGLKPCGRRRSGSLWARLEVLQVRFPELQLWRLPWLVSLPDPRQKNELNLCNTCRGEIGVGNRTRQKAPRGVTVRDDK